MREITSTFEAVRPAAPGQLFFDIETTGLSADRAIVYLIGCAWFEEGAWQFRQWFADTREAEKDVLKAFAAHLVRFDTLVHFNGDTFDLPFLAKRCQKYRISPGLEFLRSLDLYKAVRPLKKLLGLNDLKLKSLERFLGIEREDKFNGGQLIEVYDIYLGTRDPKLERFLMLHNEEDVQAMPSLLPILDFLTWRQTAFRFQSLSRENYRAYDGEVREEAFLTFQAAQTVPHAFTSHHTSGAILAVRDTQLTLRLPLLTGTLKHFYPNYRDYYYLPLEGRAIHKSVGEFVDKAYREKATAANCFVAKEGTFLPLPSPCIEPAFRTEVKDKNCYIDCDETHFKTPDAATDFVHGWLTRFSSGK